jgi:hypothetical protein
MRSLTLTAALALASCGGNPSANDAAVQDETEAAEVSAVNDATAIDAATGEAANMAADVNYTLDEAEMNEAAGNAPAATTANATANNGQ